MRHKYGEMEVYLNNLLTIPSYRAAGERFTEVDKSLQQFSSIVAAFELSDINRSVGPYIIDWTYVIDLDREIFSVNRGVHYKLYSIPREGVWEEALGVDERGAITVDVGICGEECIANPMR